MIPNLQTEFAHAPPQWGGFMLADFSCMFQSPASGLGLETGRSGEAGGLGLETGRSGETRRSGEAGGLGLETGRSGETALRPRPVTCYPPPCHRRAATSFHNT